MLGLIAEFPAQMKSAIELGRSLKIKLSNSYSNITISGLGGSGIGGKIVSQLVAGTSKMPVLTNNGYHMPAYVSKGSLVIICSYSGNTEETVSAMEEAHSRGAEIICISSGGRVTEMANEHGYQCIAIPGGQPPRSQFGYSSIMLIFIMQAIGVLSDDNIKELDTAVELLVTEQERIKKLASTIASKISRRVPVIYAEADYEGVAIRWKQQFNENSKMLCWSQVIPEMNHNELVGWAGGDDRFAAIIMRNQDDFIKNKIRMDISQQIISQKSDMVMEVASKGDSRIEHIYYLVHLGDWMSYYLAQERDVDPVVIDEIDHLKSELSKY